MRKWFLMALMVAPAALGAVHPNVPETFSGIWRVYAEGTTCILRTYIVKKEGVLVVRLSWSSAAPEGMSAYVGQPDMYEGGTTTVESPGIGSWTTKFANMEPLFGAAVANVSKALARRRPFTATVHPTNAPPVTFSLGYDEDAAVTMAMFDGCKDWMKHKGRDAGLADKDADRDPRFDLSGHVETCALRERLEDPAGNIQVSVLSMVTAFGLRSVVGLRVFDLTEGRSNGWSIEPKLPMKKGDTLPDEGLYPLAPQVLTSLAKDLSDGKSFKITMNGLDGRKHEYHWGSPQLAANAAMFRACLGAAH